MNTAESLNDIRVRVMENIRAAPERPHGPWEDETAMLFDSDVSDGDEVAGDYGTATEDEDSSLNQVVFQI
jgi:hypothetical protein